MNLLNRNVLITALGVVVTNVVLFSPGLVGLSFTGGLVSVGISCLIVFWSVGLLVIAFMQSVKKVEQLGDIDQLQTPEDLMMAMKGYDSKSGVRTYVKRNIEQMNQWNTRKVALMEVIGERFEPTSLTHGRFISVVQSVEKLFFDNIKSTLHKLVAFDDDDYRRFKGGSFSKRSIYESKEKLYSTYFSLFESNADLNDAILLDLELLHLEVTKLSTMDTQDVTNLPSMVDLQSLIDQTKHYKV